MRIRLASVAVCAVLGAAGVGMAAAPVAQAPAAVAPPGTAALKAQYEKWRTEFKTWGKWAPVGQESRGTSSLITPEKVASAMKLVRNGIVVSLAHAVPQKAAADVNPNGVFKRTTNAITDGGTTDNYQVNYHGQTIAHIDTWCHFFENGQMYNGVPVKDNITNEEGCIKGSIMNWKGGITTRAVLYDIAALKGVEYADPDRADHACRSRSVGTEIGREDRTGRHSAAVCRPVEKTRCVGTVGRPGGGLLPRHDPMDV